MSEIHIQRCWRGQHPGDHRLVRSEAPGSRSGKIPERSHRRNWKKYSNKNPWLFFGVKAERAIITVLLIKRAVILRADIRVSYFRKAG